MTRYLGMREDRLEGEEYFSLIDEFMAAIKLRLHYTLYTLDCTLNSTPSRWPTALVQFEDFQSKHAIKLLMR